MTCSPACGPARSADRTSAPRVLPFPGTQAFPGTRALAGLAAAEGELTRAAELAGARDALRARTGTVLPPVHRAAYEQMLDVVRSGLGAAGFAAAHARLADQPPPELIAEVTSGGDSP